MKIETIAVHGGYSPDPTTKAVAVPIYQTTSYAFDSTQHGADLFDLKVQGNIYTRIMNPTTDVLEKRLAALEGGIGALGLASGMAAITSAIMTIAEAGDNIVQSEFGFLSYRIAARACQAEVKFAAQPNLKLDVDLLLAEVDERTKMVFIANPDNPTGAWLSGEEIRRLLRQLAPSPRRQSRYCSFTPRRREHSSASRPSWAPSAPTQTRPPSAAPSASASCSAAPSRWATTLKTRSTSAQPAEPTRHS